MRISIFFAAVTLLLAWLLPSHFMPWKTAYQELLAGGALILALLSLSFFSAKNKSRVQFFALLCLLLSLIPFVQLAAGLIHYAGDTWLSSLYIAAFALSLIVGFNLQNNSPAMLRVDFVAGLSWLLLAGSLISTALAVSQWFGYGDLYWVFPLPEGSRPSANLAQPNNFATLLGMGLAGAVYLFETRKLPRAAAIVLALILLFGIALSQSRSPWLVAIFIVLFWAWQRRTLPLRLTNTHMLIWLAVYIGMVFALPLLAEALGISSSSPVERAQQMSRLGLYKQFSTAVLQGPWYGYGWNQGFAAQASTALDVSHYEPSYYAHNVLLDLLVWNGPILGGLLIAGVAGWLLLLLIRAKSLPATFAWLALSFFIMHSMLEYPHAYLFFLVPAGVLLGVLQASVSGEVKTLPLPRWLLGCFAIAGAVLLGVVWRDYTIIEVDYLLAQSENQQAFIPQDEQAASRVYTLTQMREYIYFLRLPLHEPYADEQLQPLRIAVERYPRFYFLLKGAYILTLNDHVDEAEAYLYKIRGLYRAERFERSLAYLAEKAEEHPKLLTLVERFNYDLKEETP